MTRSWWLAAAAACALALAGCSQNNGTTVRPTQALQGVTNTPQIEARDFAFAPNQIQVPAGDVTLTMKNAGSQKHAFELYRDEQYKDAVPGALIEGVDPGQSGIARFELPAEEATYYFRCEIHPERMHGQVKIASRG